MIPANAMRIMRKTFGGTEVCTDCKGDTLYIMRDVTMYCPFCYWRGHPNQTLNRVEVCSRIIGLIVDYTD